MTIGVRWRTWVTKARLLATRVSAAGPPIIVASTHRTASSSTYEALRAACGTRVIKCHRLNRELMTRTPVRGVVSGAHGLLANRMHGDFAVHESIVVPRRPARFVMLVRDPVAVMVSLAGLARSAAPPWGPQPEENPAWPACTPYDAAMINWFDGDVQPALGWSALDHPFDVDRGAGTYEHGPWSIIVLRSDLADDRKGKELSQFLGHEGITLRVTNSAEHRGQSKGLAEARAALATMPDAIDRLYSHRCSRHFFSGAELARLRQRWLGG